MANPYPAEFQDGGGNVRIAGQVNFTDPDNQPGGGGSQNLEQVLTEGNQSNGLGIDLGFGGIANAGGIDGVGTISGTGDTWDTGGGEIGTSGGDVRTFGGGIDTNGGGLNLGTGTIQMNSGEITDTAAFVANGSTVDQLRDALIAVGLMQGPP